MSDLNMMVNTGGVERTITEWTALIEAGGFQLSRSLDIDLGWSVLEAHSEQRHHQRHSTVIADRSCHRRFHPVATHLRCPAADALATRSPSRHWGRLAGRIGRRLP